MYVTVFEKEQKVRIFSDRPSYYSILHLACIAFCSVIEIKRAGVHPFQHNAGAPSAVTDQPVIKQYKCLVMVEKTLIVKILQMYKT